MNQKSIQINQKSFIQMRLIINETLSTDYQTIFGATPLLETLTKLRNDKKEYEKLLQRMQLLLKATEKQKNLNHPLVNRGKPKEVKIDWAKLVEQFCEQFTKMKTLLQTKHQTATSEKQSNQVTRIETIISYLYQMLDQQRTQPEKRQLKLNIQHAQSLEEFERQLLIRLIQKLSLSQSAKIKNHKEIENIQIYSLVEMVKVLSNSKSTDYDVNKEFQKLSKQAKQLINPLINEIKRLKIVSKGFIDQIITQNLKVPAVRYKTESQQELKAKQMSIDQLLKEASVYKAQNDKLKNVLKQLDKTSKIVVTQKQMIAQNWKKQRVIEIQKLKDEEPKNILLYLFEYISQSRDPKLNKPIEGKVSSDKRIQQLLKHEQETKTILQKKEQQLNNCLRQKVQLQLEASNFQNQIKSKNQRIKQLQAKLQTIQKQLKQKDFKNDIYAPSNSPTKSLSRTQAELRKRCEDSQKRQGQLNTQLNALREQLRFSNSQPQQTINRFQIRIKELEKNNLNNTKDVNQQANRLKQELALKTQTVQNMKLEIASITSQKRDLQRQLHSINEKLTSNREEGNSKENLIILALRQNQKVNKENLTQLKNVNANLSAEIKKYRQQLEKLKIGNLQKQTLIQTKQTIEVKLASIEKDFLKLQQNYKQLNQLYLQTKQGLERQQKSRQLSDTKNREQQIKKLQLQLSQHQINRKKFTDVFLQQANERDQTIAKLKMQIDDVNSKLQKFTDNSELSKLKNRTLDLQRDVQSLRKENSELKTNLQTKEREIISIKIQKLHHRT